MPRDYASFTTLITQKLQSAGTADFSVSEVDNQIEECLKEYAIYRPHLVEMVFKLESRTGTDVTGTASKLTDTVEAQFVAADADEEKVVHNTTDNTWAVVTAQDSTSVLSISANIMAANEKYELYNKRCWNRKQIYIGDLYQSPEIDSVEYPRGSRRNWKLYGDVLELDVDNATIPDSDSTLTTLADVDVLVRFRRPHVLSQLTDWVGKLAATAAAAATSISATSLQSAGTIEEGEELYIENMRSLYVVTAAATIATNTALISIYPGLEAAVASTAWTFTIRKSSLAPQDEDVLADLVAARLAINKAPLAIREVTASISILATASSALANMTAEIQAGTTEVAYGMAEMIKVPAIILLAATALAKIDAQIAAATTAAALNPAIILSAASALAKIDAQIAAATTAAALNPAIILSAATALAKIDAQIAAATASITSGTAYITTVNVADDVAGKFSRQAGADVSNGMGYLREAQGFISQARENQGQAQVDVAAGLGYLREAQGFFAQARDNEALSGADIANALGYLREAQGYFAQAREDEVLATNYGVLAARSLGNVMGYLNQATGYMRRIASSLALAAGWRHYQEWGERKLAQVLARLKSQTPPRSKKAYTRD